ncbi:MAG: PEGA domain-containing protein [Polyangiaceae bacterium]
MRGPFRRFVFSITCLVSASTFAPLALAQSAATMKDAEKHFENGVTLYGEHDFKAALVEFEKAYQIAPNPSVLYNIGQTDYELQNYAGALDSFNRYLAEGKPNKARRAEVQSTLDALRARVGSLDIGSNLDDASVSIDDAEVGKTPLPKLITVSIGQRKITVNHDGYAPLNRVVDVASGDSLKIEMDFAKPAEGVAGLPPKIIPPLVEPPEDMSSSNVYERKGETYFFVGARYRGVYLPKFVLNAFIDEGRSIYQNSAGIELDIRKDGFSIIPALTFIEYGFGDTLFFQKGKDPNDGSYWSNINSGVKGIYFSTDLLWSANLNKWLDFEYGAGFGLGVLFGSLETSWVYSNPNGPYAASTGQRFSPCIQESDSPNCTSAAHQNSLTSKVNHYHEPFWFGGGSVPNFFPSITFPQVGLRYKPARQIEARLGIGVTLTGFFFGLSADYGLRPKAPEPKPTPE